MAETSGGSTFAVKGRVMNNLGRGSHAAWGRASAVPLSGEAATDGQHPHR